MSARAPYGFLASTPPLFFNNSIFFPTLLFSFYLILAHPIFSYGGAQNPNNMSSSHYNQAYSSTQQSHMHPSASFNGPSGSSVHVSFAPNVSTIGVAQYGYNSGRDQYSTSGTPSHTRTGYSRTSGFIERDGPAYISGHHGAFNPNQHLANRSLNNTYSYGSTDGFGHSSGGSMAPPSVPVGSSYAPVNSSMRHTYSRQNSDLSMRDTTRREVHFAKTPQYA